MDLNEKKPKVSVCVVTYNQEKYIRQCLQSLVDQETDFSFEVLVADDCSTDGTRAIVQEFAAKYPSLVKPILHKKNIGPYKNFIFVHEQATGEYIAHMDGDDFALPQKLQVQSNYMNQHQECNIVWHRMLIINDKTGVVAEDLLDLEKLPKDGFKRADIFRLITIGLNSSKMYRASVRDVELPNFPAIDFFFNVEQIGAGRANFVSNKPLGAYRAAIGIASAGNTTKILMKKSFLYFCEKYPEQKREIGSGALVLFVAALKNRRWSDCRLYATVLVKTFRLGSIFDVWRFRKIIVMLKMPTIVRKN